MRIQKKIGLNAYQNVSGYDEYLNDIEWIIKQYKKTSGLGPKVNFIPARLIKWKIRTNNTQTHD